MTDAEDKKNVHKGNDLQANAPPNVRPGVAPDGAPCGAQPSKRRPAVSENKPRGKTITPLTFQ
jgi:hypothetical protein